MQKKIISLKNDTSKRTKSIFGQIWFDNIKNDTYLKHKGAENLANVITES